MATTTEPEIVPWYGGQPAHWGRIGHYRVTFDWPEGRAVMFADGEGPEDAVARALRHCEAKRQDFVEFEIVGGKYAHPELAINTTGFVSDGEVVLL